MTTLTCALSLGGCQTAAQAPPSNVASTGEQKVVVRPGDTVVSAIGTPFYLVFKGVVCVASVAIAAPVAAVAALTESRFAPEIRRDLGDGVSKNCGPPYVLTPSQVASTRPEYRSTPEAEQPPLAGPDHPTPAPDGPKRLFP